jgi:hypothetical protein
VHNCCGSTCRQQVCDSACWKQANSKTVYPTSESFTNVLPCCCAGGRGRLSGGRGRLCGGHSSDPRPHPGVGARAGARAGAGADTDAVGPAPAMASASTGPLPVGTFTAAAGPAVPSMQRRCGVAHNAGSRVTAEFTAGRLMRFAEWPMQEAPVRPSACDTKLLDSLRAIGRPLANVESRPEPLLTTMSIPNNMCVMG